MRLRPLARVASCIPVSVAGHHYTESKLSVKINKNCHQQLHYLQPSMYKISRENAYKPKIKQIKRKPQEHFYKKKTQKNTNKRIALSGASLQKGNRRSRGLREESCRAVLGTTLRSMQQPMRRISWAASLCLPLPVDKKPGKFTTNNFKLYSHQ